MTRAMQASTVRCPVRVLRGLLSDRPADWLATFALLATAEASRSARAPTLEPAPDGPRAVSARLGRPRLAGGELRVPLSWDTAGYPCVFERFRGHFVVAASGNDSCLLTITGEYRPPGRELPLVERRAARIALRAVVRYIAVAVEERARAGTQAAQT